jgi:signal transduction histidine kinase
VYAAGKGALVIVGAVKMAAEEPPALFGVDRSDDPDAHGTVSPGEFPTGFGVTGVGATHRWFFEQVAPMFAIDRTLGVPLRSGETLVGGVLWETARPADEYQGETQEMQAFAGSAALALQQAQRQERQQTLCEQLAQTGRLLQEAQQELLQKRSLATVGEMACGAAHEINNPLAVVVGRAEYLAKSEERPERRDILNTIAAQGREITRIITELMEFARPALPQLGSVSVPEVVEKAINAEQEHAQRQHVRMETVFAEGLPQLFVDDQQISRALAELISNAIEAYQGQGGVVQVSCRCDELDSEVMVEVADQGCGMDDETLRRAFDPFFSARPAGRRRGLGLSRSRSHIENNGGHLKLHSEPGKGSVARVMLPIHHGRLVPEVAAR